MSNTRVAIGKFFTMTAAVSLLTGCIQGGVLDMDRSVERKDPSTDQFGQALPQLRNPDNNGIISYDDYQVAIARRGETLDDIASRLGLDPVALARNNGIRPNDRLRDGNVIVLPKDVWVGERTSAQGANDLSDTNDTVEITKLAQSAIDDADPKQAALSKAGVPRAEDEPIRHRVERGETAFTISRLYNVSVRRWSR